MIYNNLCTLSMFTMCLCSFFGHFNQRSEWQLIKIDYKSIYSRKCTEEDYQTWHLHNQVRKIKTLSAVHMHVFFFWFFYSSGHTNEYHSQQLCLFRQQGEPCVMGQKQIYMKRRPGNYCMLGKDYSRILSAESCICRAHDFEW